MPVITIEQGRVEVANELAIIPDDGLSSFLAHLESLHPNALSVEQASKLPVTSTYKIARQGEAMTLALMFECIRKRIKGCVG